jgi:predicted RNA binding protein YcfA (HicA-like mRNA interferase family)
MPKLPTGGSGRQVRAALERAGFVFRRQTGSHMVRRRDDLQPAWWFPITTRSDKARFVGSLPTPA